MVYEEVPHVFRMVLITGRKLQDKLMATIAENGGHVISVFYGKGSVRSGFLMDMLGLVDEKNKVLITCLISESEIDVIFDILVAEYHFDKPNTGIAYVVPVESLSY